MDNFRQTLKVKVSDISSKDLSIDFAEPKVILVQSIIRQMIRKVVDIIDKELPSAQPEIIRCKDCKYWREHKYAKETKRHLTFCGFNVIYTEADDYCSKAERGTE